MKRWDFAPNLGELRRMALAAPLPTGAVTFAFTDIEGSTARWERDRGAMQEAVRRHDAILRAAIAKHGGHVFKTVGDAFCAAFTRPEDAVAAMCVAQQELAVEDFSAIDGLRVRAAIHTGSTDERDGDYFGPPLNRVARLLAIGHGGQILLSGVARDLAHAHLCDGASLVDLGRHRLQDLTEPEHVWQLNIAGLAAEFPPLRSLDAIPNNLPITRTSFVGREPDVTEVKRLLAHHGLVTLVGSGGVGKTRLAIQVGAELSDRYPDGVWFVDLAPIDNPELVSSVAAQAIGMSQQQRQRVDEAIPQWLRRKNLLLILDNCEQVLEPVAALAAAILRTAQDVRIVATTRQALNISGEVAHSLQSLAMPIGTTGLKSDEALTYGAIALFADRAKAANTRFALTDDNASVVAEICRRLDGIALAIELAAARVKVLSIPNLAQRLDERFRLLTGGSRDALPRQKTLTALIDWSYDLLDQQEKRLFARLGIFAGGFGLDAATNVCSGESLDEAQIFDLLTSLTHKSLVVADTSGEHERYRLLESTTAYALEKLNAAGQREALRRRHAEYFRARSEAAYELYGTCSTSAWIASAELELDNYRAALDWSLAQGHDAVLGAAIATALTGLWPYAGLIVEQRYWIELALPRVDYAEEPAIAARLQAVLSILSYGKRRYEAAKRSMELYKSVGDLRGAARAQASRGAALAQMGRLDEARIVTAKALARSRECGDSWNVANSLFDLAYIEWTRGDLQTGRKLYAQALLDMKALGDENAIALVSGGMAELEFAAGDAGQALRLATEAIELISHLKDLDPSWHANLAVYRTALGDLRGAREAAREAVRLARRTENEIVVAIALQHLALLSALGHDARRGARLRGYVDAQYGRLGFQRETTENWGYDRLLGALHDQLTEAEIDSLAAEGAAWCEDHAVAQALKV